jgi:hypothetical protein
MLSDGELRVIKARCEHTTPGPWFHSPNYLIGGYWVQNEELRAKEQSLIDLFISERDAEFVATAKTDIPKLLQMIEELKQQLGVNL